MNADYPQKNDYQVIKLGLNKVETKIFEQDVMHDLECLHVISEDDKNIKKKGDE